MVNSLIESGRSLSEFVYLRGNQAVLLARVRADSLTDRQGHQVLEQILEIGCWAGELDRLSQSGLPRGLQSIELGNEVIVDEVIVFVGLFEVSLQTSCQFLHKRKPFNEAHAFISHYIGLEASFSPFLRFP